MNTEIIYFRAVDISCYNMSIYLDFCKESEGFQAVKHCKMSETGSGAGV